MSSFATSRCPAGLVDRSLTYCSDLVQDIRTCPQTCGGLTPLSKELMVDPYLQRKLSSITWDVAGNDGPVTSALDNGGRASMVLRATLHWFGESWTAPSRSCSYDRFNRSTTSDNRRA